MHEFLSFRLDIVNQCLWRRHENAADERMALTPKAFAVLSYLVEHAGRLVTQDELLEAVWPETYIKPEVLKSRIFELRRALDDRPRAPCYIETVPRRGYRFIAVVDAFPAVEPDIFVPPVPGELVGREHELGVLHECLHRALSHQRQLVLVTGEPGIGKTALVDAFEQQAVAEVPGLRLARGQCLEGYGGTEAYYPMLEALGQLWRGSGGEAVVQTLATHAPTWLVQFPALVTRDHRDTLQRELLGATRERMLREIAEALEVLTAEQPLLLIFEDLHWVDPATVDLLGALARRRGPARLMVVATYRPVELAFWQHPLKGLTQELLVHQLCHELALEPLGKADVAAYLAVASGGTNLPAGLAGLVYRQTEGNPLFMRAVLDHLTQKGLLDREADGWYLRVPLAEIALGVPENLRQMIDAQIERLGPEEQYMLEVASVAGMVFTPSVIASATQLEPDDAEAMCEALSRRQHLVRAASPQSFPDGRIGQGYEFVHALYREVCYWRQTPSRRATWHRRLGEQLEALFAAQRNDVAPELAYHFEAGTEWMRAVTYLQMAANTAVQRYAYREAATMLQRALVLVGNLPEAPVRTQHALTLYSTLGAVLQTLQGLAAPEVEQAYTQAHALCQQVGETPELAPVLFGLWRFYISQPQLQTARELGDTLLRLVQQTHDPALAVVAYYALGTTWFYLGTLPVAHTHLEAGIARYTPDQHHVPVFRMGRDPGVLCRQFAALTLWLQGYPDQAVTCIQSALALAQELTHPYSLAFAQCFAAYVAQYRRDVPAVYAHAEAVVTLATENGMALWSAEGGTSLRGWALAMQGQGEEGLAQVRQGLSDYRTTGAALGVPYFCTVLAEVCNHLGHTEDGLQALTEAQTLVEQYEERWWEAEVYRLRGVLLLRRPEALETEAEVWLQRALDVARRQEAKSLELRAAISLGRLWQQQGKWDAACQLLVPIYGWFTEGFDTADLQEAKALLEELV